jgi:hypothetical protein
MEIQKFFFEKIKNKIPPNIRLVDIVAEILNVGTDSAYRRIRSEKELTMSELSKLCQYFNISIDSIINRQSNNILFKYSPLDINGIDNYYIYMKDLSDLLEDIAKSKEKEIFFMAMDIPIVHFTPFLELMLFKIYTWFRSINNLQISYDKFVESLDLKRLSTYYDKITEAYKQIPSTEIWTISTIEPVLHLIDYYSNLNCFENKNTLSIIYKQFLQLIDRLEKCAENESKENKWNIVPFRMYLNTVNFMNDFMIAKKDGTNITAIKLYTINGIFTSNKYFYSEAEKWMKNTMSKSLFLSGASAMERFKFFQKIKTKVNNLLEENNQKWICGKSSCRHK